MKKTTIQDTIYTWLLSQRAATLQEISEFYKHAIGEPNQTKYIYDKFITPLLKQEKLARARRGIYVPIDPVTSKPSTEKIIIASKIKPDYYLGYHTAMEYYGSAYSEHTQTYICVQPRNRFKEFQFDGVSFKAVYVTDTKTDIIIKSYRNHEIKVCSKERLLIECIEKPDNSGGWEETLKSIHSLSGLDYTNVMKWVDIKDRQVLMRKTGYILELLKENSVYHRHLPEAILEKIESKVKGQPQYLIKGNPGPLNKKWMLYIPEGFTENLRGV